MTIGRIPSVEGGIQPTIVDAKGDLIAATAADTVNRLAVGSNGTVLTADSSTSTGLTWTGVNQMSNPIINGGMDIWQRGTSFAFGSSVYTADRWNVYTVSNVSGRTFSRQTTSDTTNLGTIQYCARVQRDSGNTSTSYIDLVNSLETASAYPYAGKTVTLSFYARKGANYSASSDALTVFLVSGTGTDQSRGGSSIYTNESYPINGGTATLTTTWQRFAFTGTLPSNATEFAPLFRFTPVGTAGAADYYEITGVQIDLGTYTASTAPAFRRSGGTIQGELAACQRYYFRYSPNEQYYRYGNGIAGTTYDSEILIIPPVPMRTQMTAVENTTVGNYALYDGVTITALTALALNGNSDNNRIVLIATVASGLTQYRPYFLISNNNYSTYLGFSAEL